MKHKPWIALDADGVLFDYHRTYLDIWSTTTGKIPVIKDPSAYHLRNLADVSFENDREKQAFYQAFERYGWKSMDLLPGVHDACHRLAEYFRIAVVSAMPVQNQACREHNIKKHGLPIDRVVATGSMSHDNPHPKIDALHRLRPVWFADDLLINFHGAPQGMHCAWIQWSSSDNLQTDVHLANSAHPNLAQAADYWLECSHAKTFEKESA
jgi:hypothetical protein